MTESMTERQIIELNLYRLFEEAKINNATRTGQHPVWLSFSKKGLKNNPDEMESTDDKSTSPVAAFQTGYTQSLASRVRTESISGGSVAITYVVFYHKDSWNPLCTELFGSDSPKVIDKITISMYSIHSEQKSKTKPIETWEFYRCLGLSTITRYVGSIENESCYMTGIAFLVELKADNKIVKKSITSGGDEDVPEGTLSTTYRSTYNSIVF